jgi:hypothetical protein
MRITARRPAAMEDTMITGLFSPSTNGFERKLCNIILGINNNRACNSRLT